MEKENQKADEPRDPVDPAGKITNSANEQESPKPDEKKHRRHVSALVAAAKGRSALSHSDPHSFGDADFTHTGTNPAYGDEE